MKSKNKLSIIIPVYNEADTIVEVLKKIVSVELIGSFTKEIIIINDASYDVSKQNIKKFINEYYTEEIKYYENNVNLGKGASIIHGISQATGNYILIQDADLEYNPNDYNTLLLPILKKEANVVFGSRFINNTDLKKGFSFHRFINKGLTLLSNKFTGLNLTDMETCYKLFDINILNKIELKEKRFGFEPEVTAKISNIDELRLMEVSISYNRRSYAEGKKITWRDGLRTLYCIFKYRGKDTSRK